MAAARARPDAYPEVVARVSLPARCVYCGAWTRRRIRGRAVCGAHADLPALDRPVAHTPPVDDGDNAA